MTEQPQFWLNNFIDLININNFTFIKDTEKERSIKILNIIAFFSIIIGIIITFKTKNKIYLAITVLVLTLTMVIHSKISSSSFETQETNTNLSNAYDTGVFLIKDTNNNQNTVYINSALNFNKGDIIGFSDAGGGLKETNVVSGVQFTTTDQKPVLILLNPLKYNYPKYTTRVLKISNSTPNIIVPMDPNISIESSKGGLGDPYKMAEQRNEHPYNLPNLDRYDWNLELSTYGGLEPGQPPTYQYQGQPYGDLKCRQSNIENPMGSINVTEYDNAPTMFGTCNMGEDDNNLKMTENQEATVSQRVNDLLFHKGNAQAQFSPMPVDTMPNDQEGFAHFCYRNPSNLINPKYATIFVNDPEKFKLVTKLAKATGTENGGGGGH